MNSDQEEEGNAYKADTACCCLDRNKHGQLLTGHYVLVLAICLYAALCKTLFIAGNDHWTAHLSQVYDALGPGKAAALAALDALSSSNNTGSVAEKGKHSLWKAFKLQMVSLS